MQMSFASFFPFAFTAGLTYLAMEDYKYGEVNGWYAILLWTASMLYSLANNITQLTILESVIVFALFYVLHKKNLAGLADAFIFSAIIAAFPTIGVMVLAGSVTACLVLMWYRNTRVERLIPYILLSFLVAQVIA